MSTFPPAAKPRSLADAFADVDRDFNDVDVDGALEARVVAAATAPPSPVPKIAGGVAAALLLAVAVNVGGAFDDSAVIHVDSDAGAVVAVVGQTATVSRGHARFVVDKVAAGAPPVVVVAGTRTITVLGTRFDVDVDDAGGRVALHEGRIRLGAPDGSFEDLIAGDQRGWQNTATIAAPSTTLPTATTSTSTTPVATAQAESTAVAHAAPGAEPARVRTPGPRTAGGSETSAPAATPASIASPIAAPATTPTTNAAARIVDADAANARVAEVLRTVTALRQAGRFDDAIAAVDDGVRSLDNARAEETLAVERALLLERAGRETEACTQWRATAQRFAGGRSARQVAAAVARCDDEVP